MALTNQHQQFSPALSDSVEDGRVAQDDSNTGKQESKSHEKLLGRGSVLLEDGAGEGGFVQTKSAPHLHQRRQNHAEREDPDTEDHEEDVEFVVDLIVSSMMSDEDISVDSDGHHVHQRAGHIAVEEEWEDATQGRPQSPSLMNIPEKYLNLQKFSINFDYLYLEAVSGKLMAEKRRSLQARLITKAVVA